MPDRKLVIQNGENILPTFDITDLVNWEETEISTRAFRGESTTSTIVLRDEDGRVGHSANLPAGLANISVQAHNVMEFTLGSNVLWRGRIASESWSQGVIRATRARDVTINAEDVNSDLRGIPVHGYTAAAGTDVAQLQGLLARYLSGSPSPTRNVNGSNLVNAGSNTVALAKKTYNQTTLDATIRDIADQANKNWFLSPYRTTSDTHTAAVFYDGNDAVMANCPFAISDRPSEVETSSTTFYPIWTAGTAADLNGQEVLSGLYLFYGSADNEYVHVSDPAHANQTAFYEEVLFDGNIQSESEALAKAKAILSFRKFQERRTSVTIGPLDDDQIWQIRPGQRISIKAYAIPYADDQSYSANISEVAITFPAPGMYYAHLQLDRPWRMPYAKGNPPAPKPPTPAEAGNSIRLYHTGDVAGSGDSAESLDAPNLNNTHTDSAWEYDNGAAWDAFMLEPTPTSGSSGLATWDSVNVSAGDTTVRGFLIRLGYNETLLSIIQNGGTVRGQNRARSRYGTGINEGAQNHLFETCGRIVDASGNEVAVLWDVGDLTGDLKFVGQATEINRSWGGSFDAYASATEEHYLLVEYGAKHAGPTTGGAGIGMRFGGGTQDLPEDQSTTADFRSWIEFTSAGTTGDLPGEVVNPGEESSGEDTGTYAPIDHTHPHGLLASPYMHGALTLQPEFTSSDSDPTANDDADEGYRPGWEWVNDSTGDLFMLVDASVGAAVWRKIYPPTAAGTITVEEDGDTPVANVDHIVFDGATVTDDGGGQVTVSGFGGGGGASETWEDVMTDLSANLVHRWKFEEASGNFADSVGSLTLTASGTWTYDVAGGPISGSAGSVQVGASARGLSSGLGSIPTGANERTIILVYKGSSASASSDNILFSYGANLTRQAFGVTIIGGGIRHFLWSDDRDMAAAAEFSQWHMVAAQVDGSRGMRVFHDGSAIGKTAGGTVNTATGGNFSICQRASDGANQLPAGFVFDDLSVFDRALTIGELTRLWDAFRAAL